MPVTKLLRFFPFERISQVNSPISNNLIPPGGWRLLFCGLLSLAAPCAHTQWANTAGTGVGTGGTEASTSVSPLPIPMTVSDTVFRSRWIGVQVDAAHRRSSAAGMLGLSAEPGPLAPLESIANAIRDGLQIGPLDIHPGLALGWEYSNVNSNFQATGPGNSNSFFVSPNLSFRYNREIGNWSVNAAYGGGFSYYMNPKYTAAGVGNQRNPFFNTALLGIGYIGSRQKIDFQCVGTFGTGLNVVTGDNTATANLSSNIRWEYTLTSVTNIGARAAYSTSLNKFFQLSNSGGGSNADLSSFSGGVYGDWIPTGKTRLRFEMSAGQDAQAMSGQTSAKRTYLQGLLSLDYKITEKFSVNGGLGARYVKDPLTVDPKYAGLLPSYTLSAHYKPTEKTGVSAGISLLGNDVRPSFNLAGYWQPRVNTGLSFSVYQGQGFSYSVSEQVQVSRGAVITLTERLFSKVDVGLSGGWQQTDNLALSGNSTASQQSGKTSSYGFAMCTLQWNFSNWAFWQNQLYFASGNNNSVSGENNPEARFTTSFNLTF